jgi:outer membrane protein OmpU
LATDLANAESFLAAAKGSAASSTTATTDDTSAVNRVRVSFSGSGETDGGIAYGASIRADNAAAGASGSGGTAGSQFVSGAFGKISAGDLDGADESAAGGGVSGVGLTGLGDHNDIAYQSSAHNLSYHYTASGLTFGYSQDTTVTSGSNSAMGVKYSGEVGGATVSFGVGQSKVDKSTQSSMSVSASSGGLTLKAMTSSNDNGPASTVVVARAQTGTTAATSYRAGVAVAANNDTDQTALSISYAMDGMTVTGFTKTVSTTGAADQDFSGFGFAYDMGGVTMKAGVVDNNDQQLIDFGLSFSF